MSLFTRWLSPFRLMLALALLLVSAGPAVALQEGGGLKGGQSSDDDDAPGLVEEGHYISPQFDVEVTWTADWAVGSLSNPDVEHAIGGQFDGPVASDRMLGDIVFLVDAASESSVLSLGFSPSAGPQDPDLLMAAIESPSFLTNNLYLSEDAELLLVDTDGTSISVLAREAAPNDDHVVFMLITADTGNEDYSFWVGLDMYDSDAYDAILTSIDNDIEVEGYDVFSVFSPDEILDALDSGAAPTEEPATEVPATEVPATEEPATEEPATEVPATEVPATEEPVILPPDGTPSPYDPDASPVASPVTDEDATLPGLVGEGNYLSPQYDVPVTWTSEWVLDPAVSPAIESFTETGVDELHLVDAATGTVQVYITIEPSYGVTDTGELLTALSNPTYMQSSLGLPPDAELVLSREQPGRLAVMYVAPAADDATVVILEAHVLSDDTVLYIELRGPASSITEPLMSMAERTIEAGGEDAMDILDAGDVVAAIP